LSLVNKFKIRYDANLMTNVNNFNKVVPINTPIQQHSIPPSIPSTPTRFVNNVPLHRQNPIPNKSVSGSDDVDNDGFVQL